MKQSISQIETWYVNQDPWGYKTNEHDINRKRIILEMLRGPYQRALDIGCGEGWITADLPAEQLHGFEVSDNACRRLPENVQRVTNPDGKYDLVCASGILYDWYDWELFDALIKEHASKHVLVSGNQPHLLDIKYGELIDQKIFKYRQYTQEINLYEISA